MTFADFTQYSFASSLISYDSIIECIFLFFIVAAVIKTYKLNAENKRLIEQENLKLEEEDSYKDFTDGHLYDNK